ncbi:MAG TPA: LemA family protein [Candidatus Acidoferrales bacterium]
MKTAVIVFVILAIVAVAFANVYIGRRNEMVRLNTAVQAQWSDVDVVLQRRSDLIPNLVETVKGYAKHEVTVFEAIANARAALYAARTPADRIAANSQLDGALGRLLVIVENYPNLKANENFLRLQDELAGTENRIAVERRKYNETLQAYNTFVQLFPNNIFAGWAGFRPNDAYFQASEGSREAPKVNFLPVPAPAPGR